MSLDIRSISEAPLRLLLFFGLMVAVRGVPVLLVYSGLLDWRQRAQALFATSTALPMLVALTDPARARRHPPPTAGRCCTGAR